MHAKRKKKETNLEIKKNWRKNNNKAEGKKKCYAHVKNQRMSGIKDGGKTAVVTRKLLSVAQLSLYALLQNSCSDSPFTRVPTPRVALVPTLYLYIYSTD